MLTRNVFGLAITILLISTLCTGIIVITEADDSDAIDYQDGKPTNGVCPGSSHLYWSVNTSTGHLEFSGYGGISTSGYPDREWHAWSSIITTVSFPDGLTSIGEYALADTKITSVIIPDSVKEIEAYAFAGTKLTSVTIPDSVTRVGEHAFDANLKELTMPISIHGGLLTNNKLEKITYTPGTGMGCNYTYPDGYVHTPQYISGLTLKEVIFSDSIKSIGDRMFAGHASGNNYYFSPGQPYNYPSHGYPLLTSISLPSSLESIGECAFKGCEALTTISLPSSLESIGERAFEKCPLTSITLPNSIKSIGLDAFTGTNIVSLTIPNSLTSITGFDACASLTSVTIPESVTSVNGFMYCTSLKTVTLNNGLKTVKGFDKCSSLTSIVIPESVTSIEGFDDCTSMRTATLSDGIETIKGFNRCSSLTSINIPKSIKIIYGSSFGNIRFYETDGKTPILMNSTGQYLSGYLFTGTDGKLVKYDPTVNNSNKNGIDSTAYWLIGTVLVICLIGGAYIIKRHRRVPRRFLHIHREQPLRRCPHDGRPDRDRSHPHARVRLQNIHDIRHGLPRRDVLPVHPAHGQPHHRLPHHTVRRTARGPVPRRVRQAIHQ